jgi:hypothetical protein
MAQNLAYLTHAFKKVVKRYSQLSYLSLVKTLFTLWTQDPLSKLIENKEIHSPIVDWLEIQSSQHLGPFVTIQDELIQCLCCIRPDHVLCRLEWFPFSDTLVDLLPHLVSPLLKCFALSELHDKGSHDDTESQSKDTIQQIFRWCLSWSIYSPENLLANISIHPNILDILLTAGNLMPFFEELDLDRKNEVQLLIQSSLSLLVLYYLKKRGSTLLHATTFHEWVLEKTICLPNPVLLLSETYNPAQMCIDEVALRDLYILLRDVVWFIYLEVSEARLAVSDLNQALPDTFYYRHMMSQ